MLQLLSPISLIAFLSLLVPIALHLWSRTRGKTVKIGSVRFLRASRSYQLRSLKIDEVWLLVLRLLMLSLLVLLLAKPGWQSRQKQKVSRPAGWILISAELMNEPLTLSVQKTIDSLTTAGNELRLLAENFPEISLSDSLNRQFTNMDYWSWLRAAAATAPENIPFWIFTSNRLAAFKGERPRIPAEVHWVTVSNSRHNSWIEAARVVPRDRLRITIGSSDSSATVFKTTSVLLPAQRTVIDTGQLGPLEIAPDTAKSKITIRLLEQGAEAVNNTFILSLQKSPLQAIIYFEESRREDARYVELALQSVAEFAGYDCQIRNQLIAENNLQLESGDLIFWLSQRAVPAEWFDGVELRGIIVSDADSARYFEGHSQIHMRDVASPHTVPLHRRVQATNAGLILWRDGFGQALLTKRIQRGLTLLQFHSRFHPQWNDLVLNPAFPEWMLHLLETSAKASLAQTSRPERWDQRSLAAVQILPEKSTTSRIEKKISITDLHWLFWLAALALFALERWFSVKKPVAT
ncbi:MAG: BatA domain-containing protein [bacterium]